MSSMKMWSMDAPTCSRSNPNSASSQRKIKNENTRKKPTEHIRGLFYLPRGRCTLAIGFDDLLKPGPGGGLGIGVVVVSGELGEDVVSVGVNSANAPPAGLEESSSTTRSAFADLPIAK